MSDWTSKQLRGFSEAAQSLRLYRRAELIDQSSSRPLIERLYVDPLPHDGVLATMLQPNTTFLIGRKGTGKSTVFQRAQHELRRQKHAVSAYLDIKTIYESSEVDPHTMARVLQQGNGLSELETRKLLLFKSFVTGVLSEIKKELNKQIDNSVIERLKAHLFSDRSELFAALDKIMKEAFADDFADITAIRAVEKKVGLVAADEVKAVTELGGALGVSAAGIGLSAAAKAEASSMQSNQRSNEAAYSEILLRNLNIVSVMQRIADVLSAVELRHLYIFVDDFSELPESAMSVFVDTILGPLNNWSNETIKFKVAAYPGRIYYGRIDKTKIDEVYLDLYKLYGTSDVSSMEEKAIDFTTRLINNRLSHYCKLTLADFSDSNVPEVYRQLFFATMGNPRNLGHILHNLQESRLSFGGRINLRSVREASGKYYEEKIQPFFGMQKFRQESFNERSSVFSLKELLESLVSRARDLKSYKGSAVISGLEGRPPTSHFHVVEGLESLLSTLELNFFLTKYFEMKDRDGREVSVFALNYGLCYNFSIEFGRPSAKREHRLYFVERVFDCSGILKSYLINNQEIKCNSCGAIADMEKLEMLKVYGMLCPTCRTGTCEVVNLSKKYEAVLAQVNEQLLLPETELGIMETLFVESRDLSPNEIATELDCSYQLVGKRGKIMEERGLVERLTVHNKRKLKLTSAAREEYFDENESRKLDVPEEGATPSKRQGEVVEGRIPEYFRETGHLSDRGVAAVYEMFDRGLTRYAVAQEMGISMGAASHRFEAWTRMRNKG